MVTHYSQLDPCLNNLCVSELFLSSVHIHIPDSFFMAPRYYIVWMWYNIFNLLWGHFLALMNMCAENTAAINSITAVSSCPVKGKLHGIGVSSHSLVLNLPIAWKMHSLSPLYHQNLNTQESFSLFQWESWISDLSTYIILLAILLFYSFYYYALGLWTICFTISRPLKTATCYWDVIASNCHVTLFPSVIYMCHQQLHCT